MPGTSAIRFEWTARPVPGMGAVEFQFTEVTSGAVHRVVACVECGHRERDVDALVRHDCHLPGAPE